VATILLVRHGETDWNRERRFQGRADRPLNKDGRADARRLAAELREERVVAVYSSPLRRALETARILGDELQRTVETDASLMEIDVGSWQGLTREEIEERFPEGHERWLAGGPGWRDGETYEELATRVISGLLAIGQRHRGDDGTVLTVTHGGPIRAALTAAGVHTGGPSIGNCTTVRIAVRDGKLERVD
jgi:broad specificity phosphatase PhoE